MEALVISADEASKVLRISPNELKDKLDRGEIPAYREGRNWKIPISTLKDYVESKAIRSAKTRRELYEKGALGDDE